MLSALSASRIWLCTQPTDMRCSFDGLSARVQRYLGEDPTSGHWFVFINRRRTMIKILGFDTGGYWIWSKRLEQGQFALGQGAQEPKRELNRTALLVRDPAIEAIAEPEREVIGEKVSYRLAQQPGSYVVLKYIRKVVKRLDTKTILTPPAPANVLGRSAADVSFLAENLVDKFAYHLPLDRQHQRLRDAGIALSRSTLIYWTSRAIDLLAPITAAQSAHVLASRVLAMDETSIKAGREAKGKMRTGWLWPVYGDADEVVFHYPPPAAAATDCAMGESVHEIGVTQPGGKMLPLAEYRR